jgi:hypothetical protein
VFQRSKTYGTRPSELLGIENSYIAFCFDEAIGFVGSYVQNELDGLKRKKGEKDESYSRRRTVLLMRLLDLREQIKYAAPG